jgi:hypothetical protein
LKPERKQIGVFDDEPQSDRRVRESLHAGPVFPGDSAFNLIAEHLVAVGQRAAGDRLAVSVLKFDANTAGG